MLLLIVVAVLPAASLADAHTDPGCRTQACTLRVDRWWGRHHPATPYVASADTAFDQCVEQQESSGQNDDTGNGYYGYEQWLPSTYNTAARMAGLPERDLPTEASRAEQREAFNVYERVDPGAWPNSVPACGG